MYLYCISLAFLYIYPLYCTYLNNILKECGKIVEINSLLSKKEIKKKKIEPMRLNMQMLIYILMEKENKTEMQFFVQFFEFRETLLKLIFLLSFSLERKCTDVTDVHTL